MARNWYFDMSASVEPRASRPYMPGYGILDADQGRGLLPWTWATERLTRVRTYWIATTRSNGRPHAMPVWGIWLDDAFYFSTGAQSRKARNLAANPYCVVGIELDDEAISVEGRASLVTDPFVIQRFVETYGSKYHWNMEGFAEPVYVVHPKVAFAFSAATGEFQKSATRWRFDQA
jgi:general stress protein 26